MSNIKPKTGQCPECNDGIEKPLIAGRCASFHYWQYRRSLKQDNAPSKPRKAIKKQSVKEGARQDKYSPIAAQFKKDNPLCQARLMGCLHFTSDVHHKRGKMGDLLFDTRYFLAACRPCHDWCESHPKEAKAMGLSENRLS